MRWDVSKEQTSSIDSGRAWKRAVYKQMIDDFGASTDPEPRQLVALALLNKGQCHRDYPYIPKPPRPGDWTGSPEALADFNEIIDRFGAATETRVQRVVAMGLRAKAKCSPSKDRIALFDEVIHRFGASPEPDAARTGRRGCA